MSHEEEEIYKTTGRVAFATALPLLIFTVVAILIIGLLAWRQIRRVGSNAAILDAAYTVCSGIPLEEATFYSQDSGGIHPAVAFTENGGFLQGATNFVKPEWIPEKVDDLELVLCAESARPAFRPLCSDRNIVNQFGGEIPFKLRSARTGEEIAQGIIVSDDIARSECLESMPSEANLDITVSPETVQAFMQKFVEP